MSLAVPSGRSWAALPGAGLVSQLEGYLALTYPMGPLPAPVTSMSMLVQAPLTVLLAGAAAPRSEPVWPAAGATLR